VAYLFLTLTPHIAGLLIEALSGHISNAASIFCDGVDAAKNIVGAPYYFFSRQHIEKHLELNHLQISEVCGLLHVAPYIHLFARSQKFLEAANLPPQVLPFVNEQVIQELESLSHYLLRVYRWRSQRGRYG
jgi:hypothetical protein